MTVKNEGLTSFAENPTKNVERDALVEANFTAPESVEKAHVAPSWMWCKSKCEKLIPNYLIAALICLLVFIAIFVIGLIIFIASSSSSSPPEAPKVYTLPSDHPTDSSPSQGRMLLPSAHTLHDPIPEEDTYEYHDEHHDEHHRKLETTSEGTTSGTDFAEFSSTTIDFETYQTTTMGPRIYSTTTRRPLPITSRVMTSTSFLDFHENLDGERSETCLERYALGSPTGVYNVTAGKTFEAFCDMETSNGGWTVVQRREDRDGSFHKRTMKEYILGFGNLKGNHWLGLEKLNLLAPLNRAPAVLRVEIDGETCNSKCTQRYANHWYGEWPVQFGSRADGFKIVLGSMTAGNLTMNGTDPLAEASGNRFSTADYDQDESAMNCAQFRMLGPWWHGKTCSDVGLNGYYQTMSEKYDISDKNQNGKRYFVWAIDRKQYGEGQIIIHVRKSTILLKSMVLEKK